MPQPTNASRPELRVKRAKRLRKLSAAVKRAEIPLLILALVWLALFVVEMVAALPVWAEWLGVAVWGVFVVEFALRLAVAPHKSTFLRRNVLTLVSLLVPALRLLRVVRVVAVARGTRVLRLVGSLGRSRVALRGAMRTRRTALVVVLTLLVTLAGAAAMHYFEARSAPTFQDYLSSLWWTAMVVVTMGTDAWPASWEGKAVCLLLATYGFAMLGYLAATLSAFLVGSDADAGGAPGGASFDATERLSAAIEQVRALERALVALRAERKRPADLVDGPSSRG